MFLDINQPLLKVKPKSVFENVNTVLLFETYEQKDVNVKI